MIVTGLITEYNPFHNGHLYHIEKAREETGANYLISVMSGNFVQRGDIALIDKYSRTEMALRNGVDLVIELPVYFAASSARYFSYAAVKLLEATGIVDNICFGAENANLANLSETADFLCNESHNYKLLLKNGLDRGISYPKARANALNIIGLGGNILDSPNNILAVEYIKALKEINSKIKPYAILRKTAPYNSKELTGKISSATAVREQIYEGNYKILKETVPENTLDMWESLITQNSFMLLDNLSQAFHYVLRTRPKSYLKQILDVNEGLENSFIKAAEENFLISSIVDAVKSKRYTRTKLQRAAVHILLNILAEDFEFFQKAGGPQYIRILGFRKESAFLLNQISQKAGLPLILNLKHAKGLLNESAMKMLNKEIESTDISLMSAGVYPKGYEYKIPLVIL